MRLSASPSIPVHPNASHFLVETNIELQILVAKQLSSGRRHVRTLNPLEVGGMLRSKISFSSATVLRSSLSRGMASEVEVVDALDFSCHLEDLEALAVDELLPPPEELCGGIDVLERSSGVC